MSDGFSNPNDELFNMPEWKELSVVRHFQNSLYVFDANHNELSQALALYCDAPEGHLLMNVNRRHQLDVYFSEILRRNHNFVAAAKSLVDHSRVLYERLYEPTGRFPEYQAEKEKRFVTDPLTQFVIRFRQFCQHYRSPDVSAQMNFTQGEPLKKRILLRRSDLLEFDGWNAAAKIFLEGAGDEIDLQKLIKEYHIHVKGFYQWFYAHIEKIHEVASKAIEAKQSELRSKMLPQFLMLIRSSIQIYKENGIGNVTDILSSFLSPVELARVESLEGDPVKWMETALGFIKGRVPLPDDLRDQLLALAMEVKCRAPR